MSYPVDSTFLNPPIMSVFSPFSIGYTTVLATAAPASPVAWGTANQARYVPFQILQPYLVRKLLVYCAATGGGDNDMGVYDANGNEIISAAAAAHPAAVGWQEFDVTDTLLMPSTYYIGLLNTTTTATFLVWVNKEIGRAAGVYSQAVGAGTLPSPLATFAALDAAVVPVVAMSSRITI